MTCFNASVGQLVTVRRYLDFVCRNYAEVSVQILFEVTLLTKLEDESQFVDVVNNFHESCPNVSVTMTRNCHLPNNIWVFQFL